MTTALAPLAQRSLRLVGSLGVVGGAVLGIADVSAVPGDLRIAATIGAILAAIVAGIAAPERLLYALAAWLVVLGLVRRLLTLVVPENGHDPLLLVEPAVVALLLMLIARRGVRLQRSALSIAVAATAVIVAVSALNPSQGSLTVGAAGLLFLVVPMSGFWIGRLLCTDSVFATLLKLLAGLAVPVAIYGLFQTFGHFPRWDERWILQVDQAYQALNVGTAVRAFSTLPSSAEYAYVLAVGIAVWLAFGLRASRLPLTIAAVGVLGTALVLESSRLVVFLCTASVVAMLVSRLRISAPLAAILVLVSFLVLSAVIGKLASTSQSSSTTGALLGHQVQGLANPFQSSDSTFFIHLSLVTNGLSSAISHPAGLGAGAVSLAADRFGGVGHQTEADPSNLAIAAGIPGLIAYFVLAVLVFIRAYTVAATRRDAPSLAALAIVTIVFLEWFNGGQYGIALLLWITIGWIDRAWLGLPPRRGSQPTTGGVS
jgi:hypothetical protein